MITHNTTIQENGYADSGKVYTPITSIDTDFRKVIWFDNKYIAGSYRGDGFFYSDDGINWTQVDGYSDAYVNDLCIIETQGACCAATDEYGILVSFNGIDWNTTNINDISVTCLYPIESEDCIAVAGTYEHGIVYCTVNLSAWEYSSITSGEMVTICGDTNAEKIVALGYNTVYYTSAVGETWETATISTDGYKDILYDANENIWIICGDNGIYYSTDATTWTLTFNGSYYFRSIVKWNNYFIIGGDDGMYYSTNGITWDYFDAFSRSIIQLACSDDLLVMATSDGITWFSSFSVYDTINTNSSCDYVGYVNGMWFVNNEDNIYYSQNINKKKLINPMEITIQTTAYPPNGKEWTQSNITSSICFAVYNANGIWVAAAYYDGVYYSTNGKTWTQGTIYSGDDVRFLSVYNANGIWVAGSNSDGLYYSTNGKTWTQSNITSGYFNCVYNANGIWVAGGNKGLYYSTDGKTWTQSNITNVIYYIYNADGIWVAGSVEQGCYYSTDGMTWIKSGTNEVTCLYNANGIWVAGSYDHGLYYSTDGMTWTQSNITSGKFCSVYNANGIWVAGSYDHGLYYSTDGMTWTQSNITSGYFNCVYNANGIWVAAEYDDGLYYSTDGMTWTQSNITSGYFRCVYNANGMWVVGNHDDGLYYSTSV